ncbi:MAG: rhodanese-like domain-containing protein [Gammaproteobacteria bacterium]|nr:rhodanese-like domain-containing protein [Gammaproteobacteria bacterium]
MSSVKYWAIALLALCLVACDAEPKVSMIDQDALVARIQSNDAPVVIDVRPEKDYAKGHIPGATNIPYSHLVKFLTEVPAEKGDDIVLYCETGVFADKAIDLLHQSGWRKLYHLEGNMVEWRKAGLPTGLMRRAPS